MKHIYLMLSPMIQKQLSHHEDEILRYIRQVLDLSEDSGLDNRRYIGVNKLKSNTWREYFETAMKCIDESEFVVQIKTTADPAIINPVERSILEKYCDLTHIEIKHIVIPQVEWQRILNDYPATFVYNMLPDVDI